MLTPTRSVLLLALLAPALQAQQPLESSAISPTLYFPSEAAEQASRQQLHTRVAPTLHALAAAPDVLLIKQLDRTEDLLAALQTHAAYIKIQTLEDTGNQAAKQARGEIATDQSVLEAAIDARLQHVSPAHLAALGRYRFLAETARRQAAHTLPPAVEAYRGKVATPTQQDLADAYDRIDAKLGHSKETSSPDSATRRQAIAAWNATYDKAAEPEAALLGTLVDLLNRDAAAQGYRNAADRKYQELALDDHLVDQTLAAVAAEAPAYKHYQQLLAQHAAHQLGVSPVLSSEVDLTTTNAAPKSLAEARQLILTALQPLGPDYTTRFGQLLDPANGRLDLSGGKHRANAGTSIRAYTAPTALYYSGYDGSLRDASKLAHEGGHAIHRELMNAAGLPIYQRSGPSYLFEGFAIFNELLLLDHAVKVAATPQEKQAALERLLSKVSLELFVSAEETTFERSLYLQAQGKALLDRAQIDTLYQTAIAPYEYFPAADAGQSRNWMRKSLVFEDPLYLVNYLYASVIAVALYDRSRTDPNFAANYQRLLRRGFDADPRTLLAGIGIQLDDPALIKPVAHLLQQRTDELQQLYAAQP